MNMPKKVRFYSIRLKVWGVYMLLLLSTSLVLFGFFIGRFQKVYKEQADAHMADVTSVLTSNLSGMIEQIDQLSVATLINQTVQANLNEINRKNEDAKSGLDTESVYANETAISKQIRGSVFNNKGIVSLRIYPKDGKEILIGTTNREYLEYPMTESEIYEANGAALWGIAGEKNYLCLGRSILSVNDMQAIGYLVIVCKNEYLGDALRLMPAKYSGRVYLLDKNDKIVASSDEDCTGKIYTDIDHAGETITDFVSGESSYYYIGGTLQNNWRLITTVSCKQLKQGIAASVMQTALLLTVAIAVSAFLTLIAIRKLMEPTKRLLAGMSAFGKGQIDTRVEVDSRDEIGQIGEAYNQMADNVQHLMEKVYSLELANKQAEIDYLKMQINPHFLYNSLDTISWLGFTSGNEKISDISVSLAKLLRASINRKDMVTVSEEMEIIDSYLLIQNCRFEDKIQIEKDIQEEALSCYMPSFLLQPLIENSITHGLEKQMQKGRLYIKIGICDEADKLCFVIGDDGKGIEKSKLDEIKEQFEKVRIGNSIGIVNVYRRLMLLYGDVCQFQIESELGKGTMISFYIPISDPFVTKM